MKNCTCVGWEKNIRYLNACVDSARIHSVLLPEDYDSFEYCPWCSGLLEEEEEGEV